MIKFVLRRNLKYLLQLIIWNFIRDLEVILIKYLFNFGDSLLFTTIMFLAEFLSGLIVYKYQKSFFLLHKINDNNNNNINNVNSIGLIQNTLTYQLIPLDNYYKIYFLIFIVSISDFVQFMIRTYLIGKFINISMSLQSRLGANITIFGTFYYVYALRLPILKHQKFSLSIIGFCILIIIIFEFIFQEINIFLSYKDFSVVLLIMFATNLFENLIDTIEKYLYEYDFVDPFKVLMFQGLYGFLISFSLFYFPFTKDLKKIYYNNSVGCFVLFIFLLIVYFILCGGKNASRVITTKLFSPMTRVFTDHFLNPFYLIYYYATDNDFKTDNELNNGFYFTINLIISIINSFCSLVFNEILICFFCGLERNTHNQISIRAESKFEINLSEIIDDDDETSQASII